MKLFIVELWLKNDCVGENGFVIDLNDSWLLLIEGFIVSEFWFWNELLEFEEFEIVLLIG